MNVDGALSPGLLPGENRPHESSLPVKKKSSFVPDARPYPPVLKGTGPLAQRNPARKDKSLLERRKKKLVLELPFKLRLQTHQSKPPLERLADELEHRLFGELSPVGSPIVSSDKTLKMYCVPGDDRQRIMIHSLCPAAKNEELFEDFSGSFWEMVFQEDTCVCALANPSYRPIYMPPQQNSEALKSLPLNVGDSRHFANGMNVDVLQITLLPELKDTVIKHRQGAAGDSPVAREVEVKLTRPSVQSGSADGAAERFCKELPRTSKRIKIGQFFSCWSDTEPVAAEIAHKIVSRLTSPNLQLHCEGGVNRSPAAAAMLLLSRRQESLGRHNLLDEVANTIKYIRRCCHNSAAIDRSARISILDFVLHLKSLSSEQFFLDQSDDMPCQQALLKQGSPDQSETTKPGLVIKR